MNILIFNGSPRPDGGTAALIRALARHLPGEPTVIEAYRCGIAPCTDCRFCREQDGCVIDDGMDAVIEAIDRADILILASPIYFSELTGPLLSLMSRLQPLFMARRRGIEPLTEKDRRGALLLCGGAPASPGKPPFAGAQAMGRRLLHTMGAAVIGTVCLTGTDAMPDAIDSLPPETEAAIRALAVLLTAGRTE